MNFENRIVKLSPMEEKPKNQAAHMDVTTRCGENLKLKEVSNKSEVYFLAFLII